MRVLIADDHALFRDGLRSLLEARGIEVVGEARNGVEAVEQACAFLPDVVLMDMAMPELNGLAATRRISVEAPEVKVIILTASEDDADLFEAIRSGAQGYLLKNLESDRLFALLEGVAHGEPAFTPGLAHKLLREFARPAPVGRQDAAGTLTRREHEVIELLVQGLTSNRDLARRMVVSENTVKFHLRNILSKLQLHDRKELVAYAVHHGLATPAKQR